ncbi:MAG: RnfABCDGE type electron transport complex subunit G [Oscillospiraceae bacterium]|jgi:electron transport complex protein RnfG|nr:RnfABCDGE type electron transport complex subunit G [Oscillospiraceae bacterium]
MKKVVIPAIALTAICLVCVVALAITNSFTRQRIEDINNSHQESVMYQLIPSASDFGERENRTIKEDSGTFDVSFYIARGSKGELLGYVFLTSATGYGGEISVMTATDMKAKVLGVELLALSETPGLGMKAQNSDFLEQFVNKVTGIAITKEAPRDNKIQAITGATITSKAVTQAVNRALLAAKTVDLSKTGAN